MDTTTPNASFQPLASRPLMQKLPVVCVVKTDVYLLGGGGSEKTVHKYSTASDTWTTMPDLQHGIDRGEFICFVRGNAICIFESSGEFLESYAIGI